MRYLNRHWAGKDKQQSEYQARKSFPAAHTVYLHMDHQEHSCLSDVGNMCFPPPHRWGRPFMVASRGHRWRKHICSRVTRALPAQETATLPLLKDEPNNILWGEGMKVVGEYVTFVSRVIEKSVAYTLACLYKVIEGLNLAGVRTLQVRRWTKKRF